MLYYARLLAHKPFNVMISITGIMRKDTEQKKMITQQKENITFIGTGDYLSFVDFLGVRSFIGSSKSSEDLYNATCRYVEKFIPRGSVVTVGIVERASLGIPSTVIVSVTFTVT